MFAPSESVSEIRRQIDHPIIDADGHQIEFMPLIYDIAADIAGPDLAKRLQQARVGHDTSARRTTPRRYLYPARNTLDRVTVTLPQLLYSRLDEIGIDFGLVYPTNGLTINGMADAELRRVFVRARNVYAAEVFAGHRDRLEPVAMIPTVTPEEAVSELEYVVRELGLKAVVMAGAMLREPDSDGDGPWLDTLGCSTVHDYDPVWQACQALGVVPTFHGVGFGWGSRASSTNWVYNHLGHFAAAQEAVCRSLVMGGVPRRFPSLRFGFLEGGVTWAAQLLADLLGHHAKRNKDVVAMYDPAEQDPELRSELWTRFAQGRLADLAARVPEGFADFATGNADGVIDDFADSQIDEPAQIVEMFARQFSFGCEADDALTAVAFHSELHPAGIKLNALFASDIGHFDVPDIRDVLVEAWEPVEHGLLDADDFRRFTCTNTIEMMTSANPDFFRGTVIEQYSADHQAAHGSRAS